MTASSPFRKCSCYDTRRCSKHGLRLRPGAQLRSLSCQYFVPEAFALTRHPVLLSTKNDRPSVNLTSVVVRSSPCIAPASVDASYPFSTKRWKSTGVSNMMTGDNRLEQRVLFVDFVAPVCSPSCARLMFHRRTAASAFRPFVESAAIRWLDFQSADIAARRVADPVPNWGQVRILEVHQSEQASILFRQLAAFIKPFHSVGIGANLAAHVT